MHDLWQDVRYWIRVLRRARGFTAVVVLVLRHRDRPSTILFIAINGVLLRPLPYVEPDRLVRLATGLLINAAAAAVGSRVLATLLFEVSRWDPIAFVGAAVVLAIAGLVASYLPARRAARLDPVLALRRD